MAIESRARRGRVISPPRRFAAAPPRRRSRCTRASLIILHMYPVRCNDGVNFFIFFVRRTHTTVPVLTSLSLRLAARIFAYLSHYFFVRRAAAPSVITFVSVFLSNSRRIYVPLRYYQPVRRSVVALNKISLLSVKTLHFLHRALRRGLFRIPAPRPCSLALPFIFFLSAQQPCSFCCSRLAYTKKSKVHRSNRVNSPPRL